MLAIEWRRAVATLLNENPILTVEDLERRGRLTRSYGGAIARSTDPLSREGA